MKYTNYQRRLLDDAFALLAKVVATAAPEQDEPNVVNTQALSAEPTPKLEQPQELSVPEAPAEARVEETEPLSLIERAALKISQRKAAQENVTSASSPEESPPIASQPMKHSRLANQRLLEETSVNETAEELLLEDA